MKPRMKTNISLLIYNNRSDLNDFKLPTKLKEHDLLLLHEPNTNSNINQQYLNLAKGTCTPSEVQSKFSKQFLHSIYNSKLHCSSINPPRDQSTHAPYFKFLERIQTIELEIVNNFISGEHYSNFSLFNQIFNLYQLSFTYLFEYLHQQILQREFLQSIGAWQASESESINVQIIGNHNYLSLGILTNNHSDLEVQERSLTQPFIVLSIRHEIMRRQMLNPNSEICEKLYNGYTIERTLRHLETKKENNIYIPSRQPVYFIRQSLSQLNFEETQKISTKLQSLNNSEEIKIEINKSIDIH